MDDAKKEPVQNAAAQIDQTPVVGGNPLGKEYEPILRSSEAGPPAELGEFINPHQADLPAEDQQIVISSSAETIPAPIQVAAVVKLPMTFEDADLNAKGPVENGWTWVARLVQKFREQQLVTQPT